MKQSIAEIKNRLINVQDENDPYLKQLSADERKGVQSLISAWHKRRALEKKEHDKFKEMTYFEEKYHNQGYELIAGVDEVGRGPLAGPVVAAAVILPADFYLPGIDDSKKLNEQKRLSFFHTIMEQAEAVSIGVIEVEEIDMINIYEASKKAMITAVATLKTQPDFLLIDAVKLDVPYPYEAIIKGDGRSISIAAASIVAKVTRDNMMKALDEKHPGYGFASNMGYGTKEHLQGIESHGVLHIHRKSFAPIKEYLAKSR
ncbi:ribonuclease HII [Bacillus mesophilum]|uniref:Ribonuclease HII n=1 Tax=Bacillus mesophilum TaxID=1071718 RepID=A0A7V7RPX2_9BACI|nr:ribonuclease HII [Bacillus mesophilum]KAB2335403.1 ribonuclease HII [Bacillus mesophilum]